MTADQPPTVEDIRDEYVMCRDLQHAWSPLDVRISRKDAVIHQVLQCMRCPTTKTRILDLTGDPARAALHVPGRLPVAGYRPPVRR
jgi:hypothetical protein